MWGRKVGHAIKDVCLLFSKDNLFINHQFWRWSLMARSLSQAQRWWAHVCCRNSIIKVLFKVIYLMLKWDQKPRSEPANWKDKTMHFLVPFFPEPQKKGLFKNIYFLEMKVESVGKWAGSVLGCSSHRLPWKAAQPTLHVRNFLCNQ